MIYILSTYSDDGADSVLATTNKEKVPELARSLGCTLPPLAETKLKELLLADKISRDGDDLDNGWGGVMLHIVEESV